MQVILLSFIFDGCLTEGILKAASVMPKNVQGIAGLQWRACEVINPGLLLSLGRVFGLSPGDIGKENVSSISSSTTTNAVPNAKLLYLVL